MKAASFKVSVKPSVLRTMHFLGMFEEVEKDKELKDLSSEHIRKTIVVKSLVQGLLKRFFRVLECLCT